MVTYYNFYIADNKKNMPLMFGIYITTFDATPEARWEWRGQVSRSGALSVRYYLQQ